MPTGPEAVITFTVELLISSWRRSTSWGIRESYHFPFFSAAVGGASACMGAG
ncbi:CRISPR-associated protein Cas5 [Luteolibacter sp. Populi]|uniref:CRISPR-associated protein Cas5 n=1 Tax=Luteolibacter sp. Populi TaxID=3230487 RepID=UPI0034670F8A